MIDFAARRLNMVESQLRPNEVTDTRLLQAMRSLPRERFVPEGFRDVAYMDGAIEIFPSMDGAPARYMLAPMVLARLLQLAAVGPEDSVLDIGCGTGYSTAVLAQLGRNVVGLEPEPELADAARERLRAIGIANAKIVEGPLEAGYRQGAPYDVILMNGSVPQIPDRLTQQLRDGGRLAAIIAPGGNAGSQGRAYLFVRVGDEASGLPHFDTGARPLPGFESKPHFTL